MMQFLIFLLIFCLFVGVLYRWRRDRKLLAEARSALKIRGTERNEELENANEDLKREYQPDFNRFVFPEVYSR